MKKKADVLHLVFRTSNLAFNPDTVPATLYFLTIQWINIDYKSKVTLKENHVRTIIMFLSTVMIYFKMGFSMMYYHNVSLHYVVLFYNGFLYDELS